jgi:hypothetical protein
MKAAKKDDEQVAEKTAGYWEIWKALKLDEEAAEQRGMPSGSKMVGW